MLYPRRIYELQAEEGCCSSLPASPDPPDLALAVLQPNGSVETRHRVQRGRSFRQLLRKFTTTSIPLGFAFDVDS